MEEAQTSARQCEMLAQLLPFTSARQWELHAQLRRFLRHTQALQVYAWLFAGLCARVSVCVRARECACARVSVCVRAGSFFRGSSGATTLSTF
jgi:hypothetical protein